MRYRTIAGMLAALLALLAPTIAAAHPLGNFTVNQYSRLTVGGEQIGLRYVIDMAEIPTFQTLQELDTDGDGQPSAAEQAAWLAREVPQLVAGLTLTADGTALPLRETSRQLTFPDGQGGLKTLRLELELTAPLANAAAPQVHFSDTNFAERIGWREIVVRATDGASLTGAPAADQSNELRSYPQDMLTSPLDMRQVTFDLVPGAAGPQAAAANQVSLSRTPDQFAALIAAGTATPAGIALALLAALLLGAGHALTPGHGKTIVAAYLVGARGTARHALFLGLTTTLTHTAGVFALGFVTFAASRYILPERLYPWLELISGALVIVIGTLLLRERLATLLRRGAAPDHGHVHGPDTHTHDGDFVLADWAANSAPQPYSRRQLLALGVSGGIIPCPSALVVLLSAIALNRVGFGMLLIVAFSIGMSAVLTGFGMLLVYARRLFELAPSGGRLLRVVPLVSAVAVTVAGIAITYGALLRVV